MTQQATTSTKGSQCTLKSGAPLGDKLNSLSLGPRGPTLLSDVAFVEEMAHFNRERIPERVVCAKGGGVQGKFVVTNTEICKYSRAALFASNGKTTPVAARFSHLVGPSGVADTQRDVRGFAIKFFTEQGNWDLVAMNLPVFFVRDPINFASFVHSQKRNPRTHLKDANAFWDFVAMRPESLHAVTMLFTERGIPDGFRHMHGYSVNTYKLVNAKNEAFYARFRLHCSQPIRNLRCSNAHRLAGSDPDYYFRDLYFNISRRNPPSWILKAQIVALDDAEKFDFNLLDATKVWPGGRVPLIEIGKLTLDKMVDNQFRQVEQMAFSPANMVPGIECSPDKLLMGRILAYGDAQRYRLTVNYNDIPCNRPRCPVFTPTYCDGQTSTVEGKASSEPNYLPTMRSQKAKIYDEDLLEHKQKFSGHLSRFDESLDDNYSQVRTFVNMVLTNEGREKLAHNIAAQLKLVQAKNVVPVVLEHYKEIDASLSAAIQSELTKTTVKSAKKPAP